MHVFLNQSGNYISYIFPDRVSFMLTLIKTINFVVFDKANVICVNFKTRKVNVNYMNHT